MIYEKVEASPISDLADSQGGSLPARISSGCIAKYIMVGGHKQPAFLNFHPQCLSRYRRAVDQLFTSPTVSAPFPSVAVFRGSIPRLYCPLYFQRVNPAGEVAIGALQAKTRSSGMLVRVTMPERNPGVGVCWLGHFRTEKESSGLEVERESERAW